VADSPRQSSGARLSSVAGRVWGSRVTPAPHTLLSPRRAGFDHLDSAHRRSTLIPLLLRPIRPSMDRHGSGLASRCGTACKRSASQGSRKSVDSTPEDPALWHNHSSVSPARWVTTLCSNSASSRFCPERQRQNWSENIDRHASQPGFARSFSRLGARFGRASPMIHGCLWGDRTDK